MATRIVDALDDHEIAINHENGELRFDFAQARIADIQTARPALSLFTERKSSLADPVGKDRSKHVQPDFGIWTHVPPPSRCVLVVEVIHVSGKHLWKYTKEAEYRFNRRDCAETMLLELLTTFQPLR